MHTIRTAGAVALVAALAVSAAASAGGGSKGEKADRVDNTPTAAFAGDALLVKRNARMWRTDDGLRISVTLPTPVAGEYTYPEGITAERQAQPEVYTGWAIIFNHPENCVSNPGEAFPCGPQDFNDSVRAGIYNLAGHVNSISHGSGGEMLVNQGTDGMLVLEGVIAMGQDGHGAPPADGNVSYALEAPAKAEVHVAIAPHGQVDPATLPDELYVPAGSPACECWWVATFAGDI